MGLIAIGDIHGCLVTLENLIKKIAPTDEDELVFIGDYIDRGPDSKGVIAYLMDLATQKRCVFLRGNHEAMMLDYLEDDPSGIWEANGGFETLESYWKDWKPGQPKIPEDHIAFIQQTRLFYETADYFFVHGGLKPRFTIKENLEYFSEDVFLWERTHLKTGSEQWEKTVVCGHTPLAKVLFLPKLISIDTGCVFSYVSHLGVLSAIRLPEQEIISLAFEG